MRPENANIARRITHAVLLFERWIMLFINDDQAEPRHGREDRQPGTENDARLAGKSRSPVALTGCLGQFAMQGNDTGLGKARPDPTLQLWRQVDFRDQQQGLPTSRQSLLDQPKINFGFAATGHAMQQMDGKTGGRVDGRQSRGLFVGQGGRLNCLRLSRGASAASVRRIETLEPDRQGLQNDFAICSLIVSTCEFAEPKEIGRQWRQVAQNFDCLLQLIQRPVAFANHVDDNAQFLAAPEWDANPVADICGRRRFSQIIKKAM